MLLRTLVAGLTDEDARRVEQAVGRLDVLVSRARDAGELRRRLARRPIDLVFLGPALTSSPALLREIGRAGRTAVVAVVENSGAEDRTRLLADGCLAVIELDVDDDLLRSALVPLVEARREVTVLRERAVPGDAHGLAEYTSESPVMREFLSTARRVALRDTTVLLLGETGVGKGLFVRALHNEGPRAEGPFVAVNCGAIHESLAESELFGHEKGAYTGAGQARRGRFELAHGGTLFLDEVSELPLSLQVKLLTVLEDRAVVPVGGERPVRVDVRVIAASNRDLAEEVREKRFRADLYYRLNVVSLTLPPLRARREDVPALVRSYLAHHAERLHADVREVAPDAMEALVAHDWPGNVRELVNAVERAVLMADGPTLELEDLPPDVARAAAAPGPSGDARDAAEDEASSAAATAAVGGDERIRPWSEVRRVELDRLEARYLSELLRACRGRINVAAESSGLDPRSLYDKLKRHGLRKEDYRGAAPAEE